MPARARVSGRDAIEIEAGQCCRRPKNARAQGKLAIPRTEAKMQIGPECHPSRLDDDPALSVACFHVATIRENERPCKLTSQVLDGMPLDWAFASLR